MADHQEIEHKFLMTGFPKSCPAMELESQAMVEQSYLSLEPEVRLRRKVQGEQVKCTLTIKGEGTLSRTEVEFPCSEEEYHTLAALCPGTSAVKDYRCYRLADGLVLEVSQVDDAFCYAEVEFTDRDSALSWPIPEELAHYIIRETTEEAGFRMKHYWKERHGR